MHAQIKFYGISAFEIITENNTRIFIDSFLNENRVSPVKIDELEKVDRTSVTHGAFDHLGDTAQIAKKFKVPVIYGGDVKSFVRLLKRRS